MVEVIKMTLLEELKKHHAWAQGLGVKGQVVCLPAANEGELKLVYEFPQAAYRLRDKYVEIDDEGNVEQELCVFDYDVKKS